MTKEKATLTQKDPPPKKRNRPQQLDTYNIPTNDVEKTNSTN